MEQYNRRASRRFWGEVLALIWVEAPERDLDLFALGLEGTWGLGERVSFVWAHDGRLRRYSHHLIDARSRPSSEIAAWFLDDVGSGTALWEHAGSAVELPASAPSTLRWQGELLRAVCESEDEWWEGYKLVAARVSRLFRVPTLVIEFSWNAGRYRWIVPVPSEPAREPFTGRAEETVADLITTVPEGVGEEYLGPA